MQRSRWRFVALLFVAGTACESAVAGDCGEIDEVLDQLYAAAARKDNDTVERLARQVVAACPEDGRAHNALGHALEAKHDYEPALASYRTAQQFKPDWYLPPFGLADVLAHMGRQEEAFASYNKALSLATNASEVADVKAALAAVQKQSGQHPSRGYVFKSREVITDALSIGGALARPRSVDDADDKQRDIMRDNDGVALNITIEFDQNGAQPASAAIAQLDELVAALRQAGSGEKYRVVGHCSSEGPAEWNQQLSQRRAEAVLRYLREHGVEASLEAIGRGSRETVRDAGGREDAVRSRRVQLARKY